MNCIICTEVKEGSEEHIYPYAIGSRKLKIHRVCKDCNSKLGNFNDYHITDHPAILAKRHILGIKDRNGKIPNPTTKAVSIYYEDFPDLPIYFSTVDNKTVLVVKEKRIEFAVNEDSVINKETVLHNFIAKQEDKEKIVEMVNLYAKRKKYYPISEEEIYEGLKTVDIDFGKIKVKFNEAELDKFKIEKGLLKIAYELGWYWLGDRYLDDQNAILIRNSLNNPEIDFDIQEINGAIYPISLPCQESIFEDGYLGYFHLGALYNDENNNIWCYIRLFDTYEGRFLISRQSDLYNSSNKFLSINTSDGEIEEREF
ncbi:HNH endonuclease [Bacillus massiliglaciei]|uniref:HNH endonuclease n=1 Tax=Bacillus massiliglaciei TaxID=1816693 RepID=UPI000DA5F1C0|nr:HNH endonuclease [Bacillus massiliglaciei]